MVRKSFLLKSLLSFLIIFTANCACAASIGVIYSADIPYYREINAAFLEQLQKEGFPRAAVTVTQTPSPDAISWANAAKKMGLAGVDVIITYGAPATLAALKETSGTPIVFAAVPDPEALGIAGRRSTGITSRVPIAGIIKNFKSIKNFTNLGIIYSKFEKDTVAQANEAANLGGQFGYSAVKFSMTDYADAEKIRGVDALLLTSSCQAQQCLSSISSISRRLRIPAAACVFNGEQPGIVLTVSASPQEQGEKAGELAAKVLKGASLSGMPVESPRHIEVIINLKEARELDLKVPLDVLSSATRVIK